MAIIQSGNDTLYGGHIFGSAVLDGLFAKLTCVVLRLLSGVLRNTGQF